MIVLDTNVVTEPLKPRPDAAVLAWLDRQAVETSYLTSTSLSELLVGIDLLPEGRRKRGLAEGLELLLHELFGARILPFGAPEAKPYAEVVRQAKTQRHTRSVGDGQIAAPARARRFAVATRDTQPFLASGVAVIDPWASKATP